MCESNETLIIIYFNYFAIFINRSIPEMLAIPYGLKSDIKWHAKLSANLTCMYTVHSTVLHHAKHIIEAEYKKVISSAYSWIYINFESTAQIMERCCTPNTFHKLRFCRYKRYLPWVHPAMTLVLGLHYKASPYSSYNLELDP